MENLSKVVKINQELYDKKYANFVEYKYKTNTRYQRYLIELLEKYIPDDEEILSLLDLVVGLVLTQHCL